jgi:spore coat polysaccharide biosynthesis protein SpsF
MKIGIVIQARMSSRRLPGKMLRLIASQPMLGVLLDRLTLSVASGDIVVATSTEPEDDAIAAYCAARGVVCFRGSRDNVASRFVRVAAEHFLDAFVRVNGDSPLLDPRLIDRGKRLFRERSCDVVTNVFPRSYPPGQSVEVVSARAFARVYETMAEPEDFEHVTRFLYRHPDSFAIHNFRAEADYSGIHLAVDTEEQLRTIQAIVARMDRPAAQYRLDEIVRLYRTVACGTKREAA